VSGNVYNGSTGGPATAGENTWLDDQPLLFSQVSPCTNALRGRQQQISDSNTAVWGAAVAGGSNNFVVAQCNGSSWTVVGK
jgi:hypothetical protein